MAQAPDTAPHVAVVIESSLALATKNQLVQLQRTRPYGVLYKQYRNSLYMALLEYRNPGPPLEHAWLDITLFTPRPVDVDSKYAMVVPLLDVLQPSRLDAGRGTSMPGLGWIANDTDGEGGLEGCIRRLAVTQVRQARHGFRVIISKEPTEGRT